jgi:LCP family protein required for cell wall assembly
LTVASVYFSISIVLYQLYELTGGVPWMVPELQSFPPTDKLRKRKPKKKNKTLRVLGSLILFMFFTATVYAGYVYYKVDQSLGAMTIGNEGIDSVKLEEPIAMLLMGMDSREETGSLNTDVMMVGVLHPKTKTVTVVSIPRDTYIRLEGYPRGKANSFYSRGERMKAREERNKETVTTTGPELAKEVFSNYFNIPINHFVTIDFEGFRKVVDAFGGLEIYVDQEMHYIDRADGTNIDLREGQQVLDGKNTLDFVRFRKSNRGGPDSNDIERNERQQQVISQMVDKLKSFNGFLKIGEILEITGDHIRTDLTKSQMKSFLQTFAGTKSEQIRFLSLKGEWRSPYIRVGPEELNEVNDILQNTWNGTLLPVEPDSNDVNSKVGTNSN